MYGCGISNMMRGDLEKRVYDLESILMADSVTLIMTDSDPGRRGVRLIGLALCFALAVSVILLAMQTTDTAMLAEMIDKEGNGIRDSSGLRFDLLAVLRQLMLMIACGVAFMICMNMIRYPRFFLSQVVSLMVLSAVAIICSHGIFKSRQFVQEDFEDKRETLAQAMQREQEKIDADMQDEKADDPQGAASLHALGHDDAVARVDDFAGEFHKATDDEKVHDHHGGMVADSPIGSFLQTNTVPTS